MQASNPSIRPPRVRASKAVGLLLPPYLGWVWFAAFLIFTLWRMIPE